jgi:hypothetical protein
MALGIGMPPGVRGDLGLVELGALVGAQRLQRINSLTVAVVQHVDADRRAPVGIAAW